MTKLQDFLNSPISEVSKLRRAPKAGDLFGIELECEGKGIQYDGTNGILRGWAPHNDGSLRNHHGEAVEWVFNGPAPYKMSVQRVNDLFDYFDKNKAKLVCSNRTSTHVHFNMSDKTCYQLVNMFILFTMLEGILDRYCGEDRVGNLFCLSSRHAEEQIEWMNDVVFRYQSFVNLRDDWRYCSFNFASVNKFGSVEFRGMRGLDKREDVLAWLSIINEFCDYACYKMKNPIDIIKAISVDGATTFLRKIFSRENYVLLTKGLHEHEISASIYEGLRLVQMLCYRVGTEFDQVKLRGRDFWASFKQDKEPEFDIDPEDFDPEEANMPVGGFIPALERRNRPPGRRLERQLDPVVRAQVAEEMDRLRQEFGRQAAGPIRAGEIPLRPIRAKVKNAGLLRDPLDF